MKSKSSVSIDEDRRNNCKPVVKDELRTEYDLENLRVRKVGYKRRHFGKSVAQLDPDNTKAFPNNADTNETL